MIAEKQHRPLALRRGQCAQLSALVIRARHRHEPSWCRPAVIGYDVPPFSLVGGNPARVIRMLDENDCSST